MNRLPRSIPVEADTGKGFPAYAAIDNILVRNPIDVTRDIVFSARINHVGRSSLEIGIRVEQQGEPGSHIACCYFTMAARSGMGEDAVSVKLPPLEYTDEIKT
jgi:acyl-coenzyme A thioesterase 9